MPTNLSACLGGKGLPPYELAHEPANMKNLGILSQQNTLVFDMTTENINTDELEKQLDETIKEIAFLQAYARSLPGDRITEKAKDALSQLAVHNFSDTERISQEQLRLALSIHGQLCEIVLPATIRSLKATDPEQGMWEWLKQVWAIPIIALFTVIAFLTFLYQSTNINMGSMPHVEEASQKLVPDTTQGDHKPVPNDAQDTHKLVP